MATRIGVDIGGTFTDLIFYDDESGDVCVAKAPTTPFALEGGVLNAVGSLSEGLAQSAKYFMHGTTIGLNALLQATGARTGLICTLGFRDSLEIRRGDRAVMYDLFWKQPTPLVRRRHRLPVRERIRADGEVMTPLEEDDVVDALETFSEAAIESIAVCLMNAYVNPSHELAVERVLRDHGFEGDISLSHRLSREYREYERTSTTVIDASIRGVTSRYLKRLVDGLEGMGFDGEVFVMRSGGGAMAAGEAEARPFESIQSGPVAGAEGAAELCRRLGWDLAITADVGGTSFDTSLIIDGRPQVRHEGSILGWPIQTSWIDVHSIGAGGGSIAYVDNGLLRVGPQSAGAVPGPACYGRGGEDPTVTDAALLLGMLGNGVLSDAIELDVAAAERAVRPVADSLGLSAEETTRGILRVATSAMADAIREITIGQGHDPRQAKLMTFGGAGSLFGTLLATELEIGEVVVPPYAGNFSAWGLLGQDVTQETARTLIRPVDDSVLDELNRELAEMVDELDRRSEQDGPREVERVAGFDIRYVGQEHTLTVHTLITGPLTEQDLTKLGAKFEHDYERRFGTTLDQKLELVTLRATLRKLLPRSAPERRSGGATLSASRPGTVQSFSFLTGNWLEFAVWERDDISRGETRPGPAVIFEATATTYLDAGFMVEHSPSGCLLIRPIK